LKLDFDGKILEKWGEFGGYDTSSTGHERLLLREMEKSTSPMFTSACERRNWSDWLEKGKSLPTESE